MNKPTAISKDKLLLVEGNDQRNFFEAFLSQIDIADDVQVMNFGGIGDLRKFLSALVKMPDFSDVQSVGLVRDAENSEVGAVQSVQSSLESAGLPIPTQAGVNGVDGHPRVGILILPGNGQPGMLETLVNRTFADTEIDNCISDFFVCVKKSATKSTYQKDKARTFAFLAVTPNAHHSVGVAAKQGVVNVQHGAFNEVRNFLRRL